MKYLNIIVLLTALLACATATDLNSIGADSSEAETELKGRYRSYIGYKSYYGSYGYRGSYSYYGRSRQMSGGEAIGVFLFIGIVFCVFVCVAICKGKHHGEGVIIEEHHIETSHHEPLMSHHNQ